MTFNGRMISDRTRGMESQVPPPVQGRPGYDPTLALQTQMNANTQALRELLDALKGGAKVPQDYLTGLSTPQEIRKIDLTTAHTDFLIEVPPCKYIQAISDGGLDGIFIKQVTQDQPALPLLSVNLLPVVNIKTIYLTNDVRQGRSYLSLIFSRTEPLGLSVGAEQISQAELAARLGSISTYDRRGELIWMDDFEFGMNKWAPTLSGLGASIAVSGEHSDRGGVALKVVAGSTVNHLASVSRAIGVPYIVTPIGIASSWSFDTNVEKGQLLIDGYNGAIAAHWGIQCIIATGELDVLTAAGVWTPVNTIPYSLPLVDVSNFIEFKLVINPLTQQYLRFLVANQNPLVTPYKGYITGPDLTPAHIQVTGINIGVAGNNGVAFFDNFIITQNEP